jgi:hypothetical protein
LRGCRRRLSEWQRTATLPSGDLLEDFADFTDFSIESDQSLCSHYSPKDRFLTDEEMDTPAGTNARV